MSGLQRSLLAEFLGTFWLVLGGCGTAVIAGQHVGFLGVAFAFGLSVLTMAYAIGHISGCHLNPAVTIGLASSGRFPYKQIIPYIIAQIIGAIIGALILYLIVSGQVDFSLENGFAANGYGEHSPEQYNVIAAFVTEFVLTFVFVWIILSATSSEAPKGFAPIAIGLALTLIHLISIPVTNTSVNPARSISQAVFVGDWATSQLWLFILAPSLGGFLAGLLYSNFEKFKTSQKSEYKETSQKGQESVQKKK